MEYKFNLNLKEVLPTQGTININGQDNDDDIVIKKIEFIDSDINVFFYSLNCQIKLDRSSILT
ncbi:hypothetical protein ACPTHC_13950 [Enterococcus faecium]|uniref:hypothetical protein n=1 Tax=Enterococcus faecium TaxID=1352 RepID=UPI003CC5A186